jgi:enterochelin esterase-like enzyme
MNRTSINTLLRACSQWLLAVGTSLLFGCALGTGPTPVPMPVVTSGHIDRLGAVPSRFVQPRLVDVWLPEDYSPAKRYAVLYMQDGQSIFDGAISLSKKGWHVDAAMGRLLKEGRIRDTIIVGIWNTGYSRHAEYFPEKTLPFVEEPLRSKFIKLGLEGQPRSDNYLRFLVQELKPLIDRTYPTNPEAESTFLMGSSMGGIISLYAISEYPEIFSAAACLSTHWIGSFEQNATIPLATFNYLRDHLPDPASHRLYMDRGSTELDALYPPHQAVADVLIREKGYHADNSMSRVFEGAGHNETDWSRRLETPLLFLLGKKP